MMSESNGNNWAINIIKRQEFRVLRSVVKENEFFYSYVYKKAYECLSSMTQTAVEQIERIERIRKNPYNNSKWNDYCNNNIIAFCGDRGDGKTSAMLSFSCTLEHENSISTSVLSSKKAPGFFHISEPIDPTQFERKDNILSVILSRMFKEFKEAVKKNPDQINIESKNQIFLLFQKCYQYIKIIKGGSIEKLEENYDDVLIELANLGDTVNLRNTFWELLEKVFAVIHPDSKEHVFLVIQIDDMDLNTSRAHEIIEDIRKYLMIPPVMILMAIKIEQLVKAVEQSFRNEYKILIDSGRIDKHEIQQMASKYITKIIPDKHRIFLPKIKDIPKDAREKIHINYADEKNLNASEIENGTGSLQQDFLDYLTKKTGIKFLIPTKSTHYLLPKTMRELSNMLKLIGNLEDFDNNSPNNRETQFYNISIFENYLTNSWIHNHLDDEFVKYIEKFIDAPNELKHEVIINDLCDILLNYNSNGHNIVSLNTISDQLEIYELPKNKEYIINTIINVNHRRHIYSIGDAIYLMRRTETYFSNESVKQFVFIIKILYTITLYKMYLNREKKFNEINRFIGGDLLGFVTEKTFFPQHSTGKTRFNFKLRNDYIPEKLKKIDKYIYMGQKSKDDPICAYPTGKGDNSKVNFELSVRFLRYMKELAENQNDGILDFLNIELINDIAINQGNKYDDNITVYEQLQEKNESFDLLKDFYNEIKTNRNVGKIAEFAVTVLKELDDREVKSALEKFFTYNETIPLEFEYGKYICESESDDDALKENINKFIRDFENYIINTDKRYNKSFMNKLGELSKTQSIQDKESFVLEANRYIANIAETTVDESVSDSEIFLSALNNTIR